MLAIFRPPTETKLSISDGVRTVGAGSLASRREGPANEPSQKSAIGNVMPITKLILKLATGDEGANSLMRLELATRSACFCWLRGTKMRRKWCEIRHEESDVSD